MPADVCDVSPRVMLVQMLEVRPIDLSFRVLLRESSRRRSEVLEEIRERVAGSLALGLVVAIAFFGIVSGPDLSLVDESEAAEPISSGATLEPPPVNVEAALTRIDTNEFSSEDIQLVQTRLKQKGFDPGPIDGIAGKRTLAALNAYRKSLHLGPVIAVSRETTSVLQDH